MSRFQKIPTLFLILFSLGLILPSQVACSDSQRTAVVKAAQTISDEVDATLEEPNELVFSGQIADANGTWQNDYVVVLFKNGEELTRTSSRLLDTPLSGEGPMDGVFELRISNEYKLTSAHQFYNSANNLLTMLPVNGLMGTSYIGHWFGELKPNDMQIVSVPDKQLTYGIVVLSMQVNDLPESHQPGNLWFQQQERKLITNLMEAAENADSSVPVSEAPATTFLSQNNVQLVLEPKEPGSQAWNLRMTGYYGNRWDVWERFLDGRIPGLTWETFKEAVLSHNPQLEADGFVFYPEKSYLLPSNQ